MVLAYKYPHGMICDMERQLTYTLNEAAALLSVSTARVRHLVTAGRLLDGPRAGSTHLVDRRSADDLAAERAAHPPRPGRPRK